MNINRILRNTLLITIIIAMTGLLSSCKKESRMSEEESERTYINYFGKSVVSIYYLWNSEVSSNLEKWDLKSDPIEAVENIRYKQNGTTVDRWTTMMEDYTEFESSIAGESTGTYGFDFQLYYYDSNKDIIVAVITYVLEGSPAEKAGLKRGDAILTINGKNMTPSNYYDIMVKELLNSSSVTIKTVNNSSSIKLTTVEMYEDPVLLAKTFDASGKKIGYIIYNSFTAASCERLIEVCKQFKQENVKELILDLRYNGGGLESTETLLASMLAPEDAVNAREIYSTDVYNAELTPYFDTEVKFRTEFEVSYGNVKKSLSTAGANIGLDKIYYLTTASTASASEALICCLNPYVSSEIIGEKTSGKFCSGIIYPSDDWYDDYKDQIDQNVYLKGKQYSKTWGIYVMIGRYADKNGQTMSMPDGINPTIAGQDNPLDGYALGNPNETLLSVALAKAGYSSTSKATTNSVKTESTLIPSELNAGKRIDARILPTTNLN